MNKIVSLLSVLILFSVWGCSDYISSKRDGLKPFQAPDDQTKQAQESSD